MMENGYTQADRIRKSSEYKELSKVGKRSYSDHLIIIYRRNPNQRSRLGITVSKKVGNAVVRNQIKRIIRDYFRLNRQSFSCRLDINVIARPSAGKLTPAALREHLQQALARVIAAPCKV